MKLCIRLYMCIPDTHIVPYQFVYYTTDVNLAILLTLRLNIWLFNVQ